MRTVMGLLVALFAIGSIHALAADRCDVASVLEFGTGFILGCLVYEVLFA